MAEHRDGLPEDDVPREPEGGSPDSPDPEPVVRRDFFRQSVGMAAASLFGLDRLEPLLDRVLGRVHELQGTRSMANSVARQLAGSGVLKPTRPRVRSTALCPSAYEANILQGCGEPLQECLEPFACQMPFEPCMEPFVCGFPFECPIPHQCQPPFECLEPFQCVQPFPCLEPFECQMPFGCPEPFECLEPHQCGQPFECGQPHECQMPFGCQPPFECLEPHQCPEFQCWPPGHECLAAYQCTVMENHCGGMPTFDCVPPAGPFTCNANTTPPFTGCHFPDVKCEWGEQFQCQWGEAQFDCNKVEAGHTGFSCPPWVGGTGWFDCNPPAHGGAFDCLYPSNFDCANVSGPEYLCPGVDEFYPCDPPWTCSGPPYGQDCLDVAHECPSLFYCDSSGTRVWYACGRRSDPPGTGTFDCFGQFFCGSSPKTVDYDCAGQSFMCGDQSPEAFDCTTKHEFSCLDLSGADGGGFQCGGSTFKCSAGGTRCGVGPTGQYSIGDDPAPGDFLCYNHGGTTEGFRCAAKFQCSGMADDFRCYDQGTRVFTCSTAFGTCGEPQEVFGACSPSASGSFRCNQAAGEFACTGPFACPAQFANS
ncbi:MAG: hypothetical protein FJX74_14935 [Armatimonadetes bacterium]|nr:hypothetical protein [Armatimonadota bacterium]